MSSLSLLLVVEMLLIASPLPSLNVTTSCEGVAKAVPSSEKASRRQQCLASEQRTRDELKKKWFTYQAADRAFCAGLSSGYAPTYTEIAACLDMKDAIRAASHLS
jgi:hypothetical protein